MSLRELHPKLEVSPTSLAPCASRRARGRIEQRVYRVGQFDARSESAGASPTSEMKPRVVLPSSSTSMASSEDDCHDPFTSAATSAGNKIAAPGGITAASR